MTIAIRTPASWIGIAAGAWLAMAAGPAIARKPPGLSGPAAPAVLRSLTTGEAVKCTNPDGTDIACRMANNGLDPHLFYGDANGRGPGSDVLAITFYKSDPTENSLDVSVTYFRRKGRAYRFVRTFPKAYLSGLAPEARVEFIPGHVRFVGLITRPGDDYFNPTGRVAYLLDLR